jgi:hypothetical protein
MENVSINKWKIYAFEKARIQRRNLSPEEYEIAITELVKKLGI